MRVRVAAARRQPPDGCEPHPGWVCCPIRDRFGTLPFVVGPNATSFYFVIRHPALISHLESYGFCSKHKMCA